MKKTDSNSLIWSCFLLLFILLNACNNNHHFKNKEKPLSTLALHHAKGFEVKYYVGYTIISIKEAWKGSNNTINYVMIQDSTSVPTNLLNTAIILPFISLNRESECKSGTVPAAVSPVLTKAFVQLTTVRFDEWEGNKSRTSQKTCQCNHDMFDFGYKVLI